LNMEVKYYESHVTIEPVFGERLDLAREISAKYRFKVADLLMQKRAEDSPERSAKDTFTTGHSKTLEDLSSRMFCLEADLRREGFHVWRAKIEAVIIDTKYPR
jgi:hypothetical protein